jgi:hypothetical protein
MRLAVIATCALVIGCGGSARQIVRDDDGGLFALDGDGGQAHADAERVMTEHCGARGHRVIYEGDVQVAEEETHERSAADRTAQTQTVQSGDHTSWVEGQPAYAESGVSMSLENGGDVQLYDASRGARQRTTRMRTERHLEYECLDTTSGGESAAPEDEATP